MSGYIRIARGLLDHPIVGTGRRKFSATEAWIWLLAGAAWKPRRYDAGGSVVDLARGQLAHSTRYLARAWRWPETNVRRFLATLKTGAMIGAETGAGITIITICNYELYQSGAPESGAPGGAETGAKVAQDRRRKEELNNLIKETMPSPRARAGGEPEGFPDWYGIFPRKKKRKDAARAFAKVLASGEITLDSLMTRTRAFTAHWAKQPKDRLQFCPYPASWLNSGEYLDDPEAANGAAPEAPKIEAPIRNPKSFSEAEWRDRLAPFKATGQWAPDHWGPPPGAEGCLVPAHLQQTALAQTTEGASQ
jgi:hypothetical protein